MYWAYHKTELRVTDEKIGTLPQLLSLFSFFLLFFFIIAFTLQLNPHEVFLSATLWTRRGHACLPPPPHYLPSFFLSRIGFGIPTFQLYLVVDVH